jgi:hypothetical protein
VLISKTAQLKVEKAVQTTFLLAFALPDNNVAEVISSGAKAHCYLKKFVLI